MADATSKLTFALGRDVSGKAYAVDLARMPHLLIAGATGSGKSVCVNALITSLLMRATPGRGAPDPRRPQARRARRVRDLPHLLDDVIVEPREARAALTWAVRRDGGALQGAGLPGPSATSRPTTPAPGSAEHERLPYIVIVIDELADLMMREGRKVEDPIVKLAQKARAVGIHLVLATQRPSVNVVTGLIKANVPSRDRVRHVVQRRQPHRARRAGRRGPHRARRHALPARRPAPRRCASRACSSATARSRAVTDHWRDAGTRAPATTRTCIAGRRGSRRGRRPVRLARAARGGRDDAARRRADRDERQGEHVDAADEAEGRLQPRQPAHGRARARRDRRAAGSAQSGGAAAGLRPENWLRGLDDVDDP